MPDVITTNASTYRQVSPRVGAESLPVEIACSSLCKERAVRGADGAPNLAWGARQGRLPGGGGSGAGLKDEWSDPSRTQGGRRGSTGNTCPGAPGRTETEQAGMGGGLVPGAAVTEGHTGCLKRTEINFLSVLEGRSPKPRCGQG